MTAASARNDTCATSPLQTRELKHELKRWEAEFHHTHGRVPTKVDLAQHPDIADKYRAYSRLKKTTHANVTGSNTPDRRVMLPLETSILTMSLKRKKAGGHGSIPPTATPSRSAQMPARTPIHAAIPKACLSGSDSDTIDATPKRSRTGMLNTPTETSPASDENYSAETAQISVTDYIECDAVAYTPPPSLVRRYNQRASSASAQTPYNAPSSKGAAHSPLLSALGALSTSTKQPSESVDDNTAPETARSSRAIDLTARGSTFKARAGKLVKTTSIPLSAFGASIRGASQLLSSQGHLSDGNDDSQPVDLRPGAVTDLDSGELVFREENEEEGLPDAGADAGKKPAKKTTQKRSTRRVKLRPVGKDGSIEESARPSRARNNQLVSENFYKLKLKSGRRGPRSTEDRRSALYKRMVANKQRTGSSSKAPTARGGGDEQATEAAWDSTVGYDGGSDCELLAADGPADRHSLTRAGQQGTILGAPLRQFAPCSESSTDETCTMQLNTGGSISLDLRKVLHHVWQFDEFRMGQAIAMRRVVEGQSTLLSLATGAGKSLAYQLPALALWAAHGALTLVVTPLLSLMRDQIQQLPTGVQAVCLSSDASGKDTFGAAAARLASGTVQLLFVSPERLQSQRFQQMMARDGMPRVQLAVVDEAHCADEWSHSFRPAYLQLPQQLRQLGIPCVLAMTGTATAALAARLCSMFDINPSNGVVRGSTVRDNIALSVVAVDVGVRSTAREDALVELLRTPAMARLESIIVYVTTQASADRVSEYLTVRSIPAQAYHAGKPAAERTRIQAAFMQASAPGSVPIRVLVATIAFGMGLNKRDVRAVVHFNLPRSLEAYVQETGRAGRDGAPARGVLLLATRPQGSECVSADAVQLRSWAHSVGVDIAAVRRLLRRLFPADFIRKAIAAGQQVLEQAVPRGEDAWLVTHTAVIELEALEADVDADQATAQTLIGYLALAEPGMVQLQPNTHRRCAIRFTRTDLGKLAESHRIFALIAQLAGESGIPAMPVRRKGPAARFAGVKRSSTVVDVDIFDLAARMDVDPTDVVSELYQWRGRREVMLDWQAPSCVVSVTLNMSQFADANDSCTNSEAWGEHAARCIDEHISALAAAISQQNEARVSDSLGRVDAIEAAMLGAYKTACRVQNQATGTETTAEEPALELQNSVLQTAIEAYFATTPAHREQAVCSLKERVDAGAIDDALIASLLDPSRERADIDAQAAKDAIRVQVSDFVQQHAGELRSARAIARVFHGLSGPSSMSSQWMWCREWGSLVATDFAVVQQCAQEELVRLRCAVDTDC